MAKRNYSLTPAAEQDLRGIRDWSLDHWGPARTREYFAELHEAAQYAALNYRSLPPRAGVAGGTGLFLHPCGSHYLVFVPVAEKYIVVVSVLRQERDIPRLLAKSGFLFKAELEEIAAAIEAGDIELP